MRLVSALARRWFKVDGRTQYVRPPFVGEALTLYESGRGFLDADETHTDALLEVLRGWLPMRLYDSYRVQIRSPQLRDRLDITPENIIQSILAVAGEGAGSQKDKKPARSSSTKDVLDELLAADWDRALRHYAATFACEPQHVLLHTYWPLFLATMRWPNAIEAARQLQGINAASFPHLGNKNGERDALVHKLQKTAGYDTTPAIEERPYEEQVEIYKRNLMNI